MPVTPIAVSAWRTSSSLNGLIIATTSFMVRPSFLAGFSLDGLAGPAGRLAARRLPKSGIFLGKWHKKVAGLRGKHSERVAPITVQSAGSSDTMWFRRQPPLPASPVSVTKGNQNVEPIVVLRIQRPATGAFSGSPAPRPHNQGNGPGRYAGVVRRHVRLATGGGNSRPDPQWFRPTARSATGRRADGWRRQLRRRRL